MKYLDQFGYEVEGVFAIIIPDRFAVAFDGWDNVNNSNYCGVFAMWHEEIAKKDQVYFLRLAPLLRLDDYGNFADWSTVHDVRYDYSGARTGRMQQEPGGGLVVIFKRVFLVMTITTLEVKVSSSRFSLLTPLDNTIIRV
jgi:hypothetical protein